jgi:mRNA interferase RelE/StbE
VGDSPYRVEILPGAKKALKAVHENFRRRIVTVIDSLQRNPRPVGSKKLQGEEHAYRIRIADYRIIYEVHDKVLVVMVVRIGHRREVYRKG